MKQMYKKNMRPCKFRQETIQWNIFFFICNSVLKLENDDQKKIEIFLAISQVKEFTTIVRFYILQYLYVPKWNYKSQTDMYTDLVNYIYGPLTYV